MPAPKQAAIKLKIDPFNPPAQNFLATYCAGIHTGDVTYNTVRNIKNFFDLLIAKYYFALTNRKTFLPGDIGYLIQLSSLSLSSD